VISVWKAEPHEAETVARLMVEFRDHLGLEWPSANAFLAGVERLVEDASTAFLLATPHEDSPPAGVAQVRFRYGLWWAAPDCELEDLFVRADARRRGVARALVQGVIELARERGCRRVQLDVNEANDGALAMYESLGFSAQDGRYGARNLLMRLHLEARP
jgi:ribosomal protein S18 acetylase RimI-like enzyme